MTLRTHGCWRLAFAFAMTMVAASAVAAQQPAGPPPTALQGFQVNKDKPIQINATTLEVRDKDKKATFIGNVVVVQGDTTLKCKVLDVFYDADADKKGSQTASTAPIGGGAGQQIRRLEAKGGVTVIQKEQTATGETAIYDLKSNSVTLNGNVTVTQGANVIRGDRITVDLVTGVMRVESAQRENGVSGLFNPNSKSDLMKNGPKSDTAKSDNTKSEPPKAAPKSERGASKTPPKQGNGPMKLN